VALFSATLVLSAGLVFLVQPMFARFTLPLLGGAPAVWTTAMLFFQTVLLASYMYAHWSIGRFGARRQAALHLALAALALIVLPLGIPDGWTAPATGSPVPWLLLMMLVSVGLPFFVVSATAPLLQSWLADTDHPDAADPYFLYRASNIGSAVGLLSYPLILEPRLTLDGQSWIWTAGYGLLMVLLTACAVVLWRSRRAVVSAARTILDAVALPQITAGRRVRWVGLAFVPSSLMLAVTAALTTNIAPIPLLWVVPLALYLLSFILVFSRGEGGGPFHRLALFAMPPVLVLTAMVAVLGWHTPLLPVAITYLVAFLLVALACHGELAADRPPARQLTQFYAFVSLGGALGGVFNVVVAPTIFNSLTELPIALVLAAFLLPFRKGGWTDQISARHDLLPPFLLAAAGAGAMLLAHGSESASRVALVTLGLLCLVFMRNPLRFGLALALAMVAVWIPTIDDVRVIHQQRSFFGINRVESETGGFVHVLKNGTIVHGTQASFQPRTPTTYYHPSGPMGQLLDALPDRSVARRAAVVGLGAGTMACLSQPGDRWTFFEIDPAVVRLARDPELFTYLRDCRGQFDVQVGDGRLSLGKRADGEFGLIALDAFSSDAIPIHLITREALETYASKLRSDGVIAFHISNQYLDLEPVLGNLAADGGLACFVQSDTLVTAKMLGKYPSRWVALARSPQSLGRVTGDARWKRCARAPAARTWTDDYANVTAALRLR
jgi:spermidine synthase